MIPPACLRSLTRLSSTLAVVIWLCCNTVAQEAARPDRGTGPNRSYAISDIENINLQNGNVNLTIPLASLPPIAGGKLSMATIARYNSKLWDVLRFQEDAADLEWSPYVVDMLGAGGGWAIGGGGYSIYFRNANEDFDRLWYNENSGLPQWELDLLNNHQWWKVVLFMPDGSEHELRPLGYGSYYGSQDFLRGYFNVLPSGSPMRYYSLDGSYLFATISSTYDWTVYLPDGTKVIQTPDGIQRIQDTNGNKIKLFTDANGAHYQDEQTGREIRITYDPAANGGLGQYRVWYPTVGGTEHYIEINMGTTTVQGKTYPVNTWDQVGEMVCQRTEGLLDTQLQVVREIIFPPTEPGQQRKFVFSYNSDTTENTTTSVNWSCYSYENYTRTASVGWGELSRVVSPPGTVQTAAYADYSYWLDSNHSLEISVDDLAYQSITQKTLYHDGTSDVWTYGISDVGTIVTSPDGSSFSEQRYCAAFGVPNCATDKAGLAYRTTRPFVRTEKHWINLAFSGGDNIGPGGFYGPFNPVVDFEYTTLLDANNNPLKMSAKEFQYDFNGNVTQTKEYDWFDHNLVSRDAQGVPTGVPVSATLLRTTNHSHYNQAVGSTSANVYAKRSASTGAPLILNAPQQTTVGPSIVQLSYDGQGYGVAPTVGNLTSKRVWVDLDAKWITTSMTYGLYGNIATSTDARGKVTQYFFADATHALPTSVVVDPQNGTGTQTTSTAYDYWTGQVLSVTDPNGAVSSIDYTNQVLGTIDPFGRPGITFGPLVNAGGVNQRQRVTTTYLDGARQVIVATDLNAENDKLLKVRTTTDMLGRAVLTEQTEDGTNYSIYSRKVYEQMGKITYASSPMRYNVSSNTDGWTRVTNDNAGRVTEVATFGGVNQPAATGTAGIYTGSVTTSYVAETVTVTDQAGKQRKSVTDALGRLIQVYEDPSGLNYLTSYDYDVFGNLRHVYQGVQTRTFNYDSLSRLRSAVNPESGTISYTYDDNGNLLTKADSRSVSTTFAYDALSRATSQTYSDGTPAVTYTYDAGSVANSKGRLTAVSSSVSATNYTAYDALGRITSGNQITDSQTYAMSYSYSLSGSQTSMTYPSGRVIETKYDSAGRMAGFKDQQSGVYYAGAIGTDATNRMQYAAHGAVSVMKLGNGLWEQTSFNSRLQPALIGLGTSSTDASTLGLTYNYGTTNNNGNLQTVAYAGGGLSYTQTFGYDSLNRLTTSAESGSSWSQTNSYDLYGNRSIVGGGLSFSASNNRITNSGYVYDAAGNLTNDSTQSFAFDGENKIKTVNGESEVYRYDGDGNRVRKNFTNGEKVRMVYSGGQLIAEYDLSNGSLKKEYVYGPKGLIATIEPANGTRYTASDHLGSPRIVTNSSAGVLSRHDYMPFGEEIGTGIGGRTTGMGFSVADGVRQKFTLYERDTETGLDFAQARYYASTQGRFTSPDPLGGHTEDPQTLNRYTYVRNNPQRFTDPTGLDFYLTCKGNSVTCQGGRAGHTDKEGNFIATIISNDKNGGLVDQNGNTYATKITGQGVSFSGAGCDEFIPGVFLNGTKATTIQGSGDLAGFTFNFTESNLDVNITAKGTFTFNGNAWGAEKALEKSGYTSYFGDKFNVFHPSSDTYDAVDYRSQGEKDTGAGSGHFTVHKPVTRLIHPRLGVLRRPTVTVPSKGDVHFGEHNPYTGGFKKHFKEVVRSVW